MTDNMVRVNLTIPGRLLKKYDRILKEKLFMSRSEHFRMTMRLTIKHCEENGGE